MLNVEAVLAKLIDPAKLAVMPTPAPEAVNPKLQSPEFVAPWLNFKAMPDADVVPFTVMVLLMLMLREAVKMLMFSPLNVTGPLRVMSPVPAAVLAVTVKA